MKNMNRQGAKSAKKINSQQLLHCWGMLRPNVCRMHLQSQVLFFLGALGLPVERVFKRILTVKKVFP